MNNYYSTKQRFYLLDLDKIVEIVRCDLEKGYFIVRNLENLKEYRHITGECFEKTAKKPPEHLKNPHEIRNFYERDS